MAEPLVDLTVELVPLLHGHLYPLAAVELIEPDPDLGPESLL